jgi:glucose/arabinose dehydrogenase
MAMSKNDVDMKRRDVLRTAMGGLVGFVASGLLPAELGVPHAHAAVVTPNPIGPRIQKSGVAVEIVDFAKPPASSSARPYAALNYLYHAGDGSRRLFVCDSRGKLWRVDAATGAASLFLDVAKARGAAFVTGQQTGVRSFAFHPDSARSGRPGYRRLYTAHTETAASRPAGVKLFAMASNIPVHHHNVVAEWRVRPDGSVDPATRRELFRVAQYGPDHCLDQILFDPSLRPGQAGYGLMYIGVGDGGNTPTYPDRYGHAQNPACALGKILRIDPLAASGAAYRVPGDNPFVGRSGVLPEIWALGLRHPQNLSFDRGVAGRLIFTDIGQAWIEEVHIGVRGGNYGWPLREGTFATERGNKDILHTLPADDTWRLPGDATKRSFVYPVAQYDRSEAFDAQGRPFGSEKLAITGGFVYRGTTIPALAGHYVCGDLVNGRIFHVPVSQLKLGSVAQLKELTLKRSGQVVTLRQLVGYSERVDLRFGEGEDGALYVLTKQDGKIRKLRPA